MKRVIQFIFMIAMAGISGCLVVSRTGTQIAEPTSPFSDRLDNASKIAEFMLRDDAYAKIAVDAATADDAAAALEATQMITEFMKRDDIAVKCATILDRQGNREAADTEANQITEFMTRDRVRAKLAMNPTGTPSMNPTTVPTTAPSTVPTRASVQ